MPANPGIAPVLAIGYRLSAIGVRLALRMAYRGG
jgi:hypothetical protein